MVPSGQIFTNDMRLLWQKKKEGWANEKKEEGWTKKKKKECWAKKKKKEGWAKERALWVTTLISQALKDWALTTFMDLLDRKDLIIEKTLPKMQMESFCIHPRGHTLVKVLQAI